MARRRAAPSGGLLRQQAIAPRRRVEGPSSAEYTGPILRQDFEKTMDDAPMLRQALRDQVSDPRKTRPLGGNSVEEPRQARRKCRGLSGQKRLLAAPFAPVQRRAGSAADAGAARGAAAAPPGSPRRRLTTTAHPNRDRRSPAAAGAAMGSPPFFRSARSAGMHRAASAPRGGVGSRTVIRAICSGSAPAIPSSPAASVARNGRCAGIV